MLSRILEPEIMDSIEEAISYDRMDFTIINTAFAESAIALMPQQESAVVLDAGTGTARIPILIAQRKPNWRIIGIDLARSMLTIGQENIDRANLNRQIDLAVVDSKQMPYEDAYFDLIISNSLVHHLPDPKPFFREVKRVLKPNGAILIRDLLRPDSQEEINAMVETIDPTYDDRQKQLFADSLYAAFTLSEVRQMVAETGWKNANVYRSSDRHWTFDRLFSVRSQSST
jgi:ubiquinone/menaquinone biosynthesis C-methylase UbiE